MEIKIDKLKKQYGNIVACDIPHFEISHGEIIGLVGNNGAGKTTLFRLLLDLQEADEGSIHLIPLNQAPINVCKSEDWKDYTGAYIDDGFLIDFLTPEEYFNFLAKIAGLTKEVIQERLSLFEHFTGGEIFGKKNLIRNLSAGNKQKVGIIAAFFRHPELVVLDEPFNFLDPSSQSMLKHIISDYNKSTNATILISSHNLTHTVDVSTRIVLLEHGQIIKDIPNHNEIDVTNELKSYFETD